mgnify:CR=1 FL=1
MSILSLFPEVSAPAAIRPILIAGASGTLGRAFQRICHIRGLAAVALSRSELDITDAASVARALAAHQPWAVVNAAGYVRVDDAETDAARCYAYNTTGPALLAMACAHQQLPFLTFSSDLVFDGRATAPYREPDAPQPLNVYGNSKRLAEQRVLAQHPQALVVRTSAFFGPWDEYNFVYHALQAARAGRPFAAADDAVIAPTYVPDLVNTSLDLLIDGESGIWHLANDTACTWAELAQQAIGLAGLDTAVVRPRPMASFKWPAPRPRYSVLKSVHGALLPCAENGLRRYLADVAKLSAEPAGLVAVAS